METRKDEIRYITDDPKKMLGKYLCKDVYQTWTEDFTDEDTGEVVTINRNQILFEKGTAIDKDVLSNIMFYLQSGDIKEVEVSNQKRLASESYVSGTRPFLATANVNNKMMKFLVNAKDIANVMEILRDYIELNYYDGFSFQQIKAYDDCIILNDTLVKQEAKSEAEEFGKDGESNSPAKKFYQIETKLVYDDAMELFQTFVVNTFDVERAMIVIDVYLAGIEEKKRMRARERGGDYEVQHPKISLEAVKPLSVSCYVPEEFSDVYTEATE